MCVIRPARTLPCTACSLHTGPYTAQVMRRSFVPTTYVERDSNGRVSMTYGTYPYYAYQAVSSDQTIRDRERNVQDSRRQKGNNCESARSWITHVMACICWPSYTLLATYSMYVFFSNNGDIWAFRNHNRNDPIALPFRRRLLIHMNYVAQKLLLLTCISCI